MAIFIAPEYVRRCNGAGLYERLGRGIRGAVAVLTITQPASADGECGALNTPSLSRK